MDKSLLIFIAIGIGFLYFITDFVGDIQEEDERFTNSEYNAEHKYDKYLSVDSVGQLMLQVTDEDEGLQVAAWQSSTLKQEFLELFPDYNEMKTFVKRRVRGDFIVKKLLGKIDEVESNFFSGTLNVENAKRTLDTLK